MASESEKEKRFTVMSKDVYNKLLAEVEEKKVTQKKTSVHYTSTFSYSQNLVHEISWNSTD